MKPADVDAIVTAVADWAVRRDDIRATALVGSWARDDPHQWSDVDLLLLTDSMDEYRHRQEWLTEIDLERAGYQVGSGEGARYGIAWSCHITLSRAAMMELTFAPCSWARADSVDAGTRGVVEDAFRIIVDKDGLLTRLVAVVMSD
jgi:uncharacterized protein